MKLQLILVLVIRWQRSESESARCAGVSWTGLSTSAAIYYVRQVVLQCLTAAQLVQAWLRTAVRVPLNFERRDLKARIMIIAIASCASRIL